MALTSLDTYYSFLNIDNSNDSFKYQKDGGEWKSVKIPTGCYEITAINKEIQKEIGTKDVITIKENLNTLKFMLFIKRSLENTQISQRNGKLEIGKIRSSWRQKNIVPKHDRDN